MCSLGWPAWSSNHGARHPVGCWVSQVHTPACNTLLMVILNLSKRTTFVHYIWLAADNHHEPSILSHTWRELQDNQSHSSITRCMRWTQQLHQPAMLITVPHSSNLQFNIIPPPNAWSHEEWSLFGRYTVLLGMLVLIFGMITVPQAAAWHWRVWEPRISCLGTGIQTTAAQLMFTWGDYPGAWKSPCGFSRKSCMTGVWHNSCYIYYLPSCLTPWSTAFLEKVLVSVI